MEEAGPGDPLNTPVAVINIGLEAFAEALRAQGVQVAHVEWKVPANGDPGLLERLKKLC
jgi:hypothetical protein